MEHSLQLRYLQKTFFFSLPTLFPLAELAPPIQEKDKKKKRGGEVPKIRRWCCDDPEKKEGSLL